eukprot:TRINITY_DN11028_c0_g2_i4.p1 TRINITY_DN11028_c0_g2~~TRINITY_DN11028_c0_g2_i4.p1  ORF type:complete len:306 (+),score=28.66 TRINITY_DN11028_c0_g2_i4:66-920(+)
MPKGLNNVNVSASRSQQSMESEFNHLFGDDGHLIFNECVSTIHVSKRMTQTMSRRKFSMALPSDGNDPALVLLQDASNNVFELTDMYIRLFTFNIGIVRFCLRARSPVSIQTILDAQNSIMRLKRSSQAVEFTRLDNHERFDTMSFVMQVLSDYIGDENVCWRPDSHTDRLSVYTLAAIEGVHTKEAAQRAVYNIGQMEWRAEDVVAQDALDEFTDEHCYLRFATVREGHRHVVLYAAVCATLPLLLHPLCHVCVQYVAGCGIAYCLSSRWRMYHLLWIRGFCA